MLGGVMKNSSKSPKAFSLLEPLESRIAPAFAGTVNLALLSGTNGFRIDGNLDNDNSGYSVADAGDVNGDGYHDLIIGAPGVQIGNTANTNGAAYIVFGKASGFSPTIDLGSLNGTNGFKISNDSITNGMLGSSVAGAGDVNGDGFDDVVVGVPKANINGNSNCGISYIIFGSNTSTAEVKTNSINGANGFALFGSAVGQLLGSSVSGAGDINGDGYADVLIGAPGVDVVKPGNVTVESAGAAYVLYGHSGNFNPFNSEALLGSPNGGASGFRLEGQNAFDDVGGSVSSAGDFNGDGFADFIVGSINSDAPGAVSAGRAYIVYGHAAAFSSPVALSSITGSAGVQVAGISAADHFANSVHGAGDINGDGFSDIIVGDSLRDQNGVNSGESYVVYGHAGTFNSPISAANADIRIVGPGASSFAGTSVSGAGDFNGDGYGDLLVGVPATATSSGSAYIVFGKPGGFSAPVDLSTLDGKAGFQLHGLNIGDAAGSSVSSAGDVNGDGFDDLLIGAPQASHGVTNAGESYVYFGSNGGNAVTIGATGKTATYTDADGDLVTVKVNKGMLTADEFHLTGANSFGGSTLRLIDFANHNDLAEANVTISAKPQMIDGQLHGDGLVNIGAFDASNVKLGTLKIIGDLGRLDGTGAKTVTLNSFGLDGLASQGGEHAAGATSISLFSGAQSFTVNTDVEGVTFVAGKLGSVKIGGDVHDATIAVNGGSPATQAQAVALKNLTIGGDLDHSKILAGFGIGSEPDVAVGKVTVKGDWLASSITAGVSGGSDGLYGTNDDHLFSGGSADITSRIASVIIKGVALGSADPGDHFGITAEKIGSVTIGKFKLPLNSAASDHFLPIGPTGDFTLNEV